MRYVGVTKQNVQERIRGHLKDARWQDRYPIQSWLRELLSLDLRPSFTILEVTTDRMREIYWIAECRRSGAELLNSTGGGQGIPNPSMETRMKISLRFKGKKLSEEHRQKLRDSHLGHKPSEACLAKLRACRWKHTEATRQKMRDRIRTPEHNANARLARLKALAEGRGRATGDRNGLRKHPESVLRGAKNGNAKMDDDKVRQMRERYERGDGNTNTLAAEFEISQATCWKIIHKLAWKHVV